MTSAEDIWAVVPLKVTTYLFRVVINILNLKILIKCAQCLLKLAEIVFFDASHIQSQRPKVAWKLVQECSLRHKVVC